VAAAKGPDGEAGMERLLDGFLAAHSINIEAEPKRCSDYSTASPSGGAMLIWLGGPPARLRCGPRLNPPGPERAAPQF